MKPIKPQYQDKTRLPEMNDRTDGPFCARIPDGWIGNDFRLTKTQRDAARFPELKTLLQIIPTVMFENPVGSQVFQVFRDVAYPQNGRLVQIGRVLC